MKTLASSCLLLIFTLIANSCKKSTTEIQIQYKIDPADAYIIQFNYTDQSGQLKSIDNISQIQNGEETILIAQKPFTATLHVKVNNNTNASRNYNLLIYVDGEVKTLSTFTAPPMIISEKEIEYIIN